MNELGHEAVSRSTGIAQLCERPDLQFSINEITRHPTETQVHQQRLLLGDESVEIEDAIAAKHVLIVAPVARILDRELDVLMKFPESHADAVR